jgi:hypothetical protein
MKRPAFQFYPSDWLRDTALRTCSTGARGLWIDMICFMHQGTPYGHLKVGDKVIHAENLARMVGETFDQVKGWLDELAEAKVFDLTDDGVICSRRMIRDEEVRNARAEGGKKGGNPALMGSKDGQKVNQEDKQNPTPSSSSSSSSSFIEEANASLSGSAFPPCPHERILNAWKSKLPHLSQPRTWEGSRQQSLRSRWIQAGKRSAFSDGYSTVEDGVRWWESFFDYIANETKLAQGFESNGRVWKPDLPWIINATNFAKIIDGKYQK